MSDRDLDRALDRILAHEGGFSDHPADGGGRTKYGITHGTLDHARKKLHGLPEDVANLTQHEARRIYVSLYWGPAQCELMEWPASYAQMDAAVQHGPGRAIRFAQAALNLTVDGVAGPQTRQALKSVQRPPDFAARMVAHRGVYYMRILARTSQAVFASGWANRMDDVLAVIAAPEDAPDIPAPRLRDIPAPEPVGKELPDSARAPVRPIERAVAVVRDAWRAVTETVGVR
jgi:lysozyme family protein